MQTKKLLFLSAALTLATLSAGQSLLLSNSSAYAAEANEENETKVLKRYHNTVDNLTQTINQIIEFAYAEKLRQINRFYNPKIDKAQIEERRLRNEALVRYKTLVNKHPNNPKYTPDALYRLGELLFEKSHDDYLIADAKYVEAMDAYEKAQKSVTSGDNKTLSEPVEPEVNYTPTIQVFLRLKKDYPNFRHIDAVTYVLAFAYQQMGKMLKGREYYTQLIKDYPKSNYVPEAWMRLGEDYFVNNQLDLASDAYLEATKYTNAPTYDTALYKLAWTYYRRDKFADALKYFKKLLDWSDKQTAEGESEGSPLRAEALQYMALSLAEPDWDGNSERDPDFALKRIKTYLPDSSPYNREILSELAADLLDQYYYPQAIEIIRYALKKYPNHRDNPRLHDMLITALMRDNHPLEAFDERSRLKPLYGESSEWQNVQHKAANLADIEKANLLIKNSLRESAQWFHAEAQRLNGEAANEKDPAKKSKGEALAKQFYQKAAELYSSFLKAYPNDKDAYPLSYSYADSLFYAGNYDDAYHEFVKVRETDTTANKFIEDAAFNVVESITESIRQKGGDKRLVPPDTNSSEAPQKTTQEQPTTTSAIAGVRPTTPEQLPDDAKRLIDALDRYVVLNVRNPQDPELDLKYAYRAAKILYDYNHFPEARERLEWIVDKYPDSEVAYYAGTLVLDSYKAEGKFDKYTKYAEKLANTLQSSEASSLRDNIDSFKLGALFLSAERLANRGKYEDAAEEYLRILSENPKASGSTEGAEQAEIRAKALNNAAVAYEQIQRYDSAMKLYKRVFNEYPHSPLAIYSLYRVAVNQERFFDFEDAIQNYLKFFNSYSASEQPKLNEIGLSFFNIAEKRPDALRSAAILTENMQRYAEAAQLFERYAQIFPDAPDAPEMEWRAVENYRRAGDEKQMFTAIHSYIDRFGNNGASDAHLLDALLRLARLREEEVEADLAPRNWGNTKNYFKYLKYMRTRERRAYESVLDAYAKRGVQPGTPAAKFAAEAQFRLAELRFKDWDGIKIEGPMEAQKWLLKKKIRGQKQLTQEFEKVFQYRDFDWTVAANYRIGSLFQRFAFTLYEVPSPFKKGSESDEIYRTQLEDIAIPLEDKAVERYIRNIDEAKKQKIVNEWTKRTIEQLNKYRPGEYPLFKEEKELYDPNLYTGSALITVKEWKAAQDREENR